VLTAVMMAAYFGFIVLVAFTVTEWICARAPTYDRDMRALLALGLLVGCSNDVDPRTIPGGGVGDGEIDGEVNVTIIDDQTDEVIANATVAIGESEKRTDAKGRVTFSDVEGAQTIAVKAESYRSTVWADVNGANITIPLKPSTGTTTPAQATLAGTVAGWDTINVDAGHAKVAVITYSQTDDLGDEANNLKTPGNTNICFAGAECNWSVVTRTGSVTVFAMILDRDLKGTPATLEDDTNTVIGYAFKPGITVADGVDQSGLVLDLLEAGNLETVTLDLGTPPPGLPERLNLVGIEVSSDEVIQLPLFLFFPDDTELVVPKRTSFGGNGTYRLSALAGTSMGDMGAQSIILRQGQETTTLAAGTWLVPPVNVDITRTTASFDAVVGATAHSVVWSDSTGELLEITSFNAKTADFEVPSLVALPSAGTLSAKAQAIGADFDVNDFSLEDDSELLWGISTQPVSIP
jgi:hypothetical protein